MGKCIIGAGTMKIKIITIILLTILTTLAIFVACDSKPTKPEYNNVFDPGNPTTSGDPFELQVTIGNGGVTLTWTKPASPNLANFKIYRSKNETTGYTAIQTVSATLTQYVDLTVENGQSYWYKIAAVDGNGNETSTTADTTTQIYVNTRPVASFTATQDATNDSLFHFDASASSDYEDGTNLQYRWDFDGAGSWDTGWLAQDTISYSYSVGGDYTPKLSVRDLNNLAAEITVSISVFDGTVTDIDGNVYQCVKIGNQWWMAENLKVTCYNNGDNIPNETNNSTWAGLSTGAYCAYNNDNGNLATYGLLYNWYAVDESRNIAPAGWHVPTDDEWKELEMYLGMSQLEADKTDWRGTDEGGKLKETGFAHWNNPNTGATNSSGFTALPGGYRTDYFSSMDLDGFWWSSTESGSTALDRNLYYTRSRVSRNTRSKLSGFSIRCIRD